MGKENKIEFMDVKVYLEFCVFGEDYDECGEDINLKVGCGRDIECYMQAYFKEDWEGLFNDKCSSPENITHVSFGGIRLVAKDSDGHTIWASVSGKPYAAVELNVEKLSEENAINLKRIREILNA